MLRPVTGCRCDDFYAEREARLAALVAVAAEALPLELLAWFVEYVDLRVQLPVGPLFWTSTHPPGGARGLLAPSARSYGPSRGRRVCADALPRIT